MKIILLSAIVLVICVQLSCADICSQATKDSCRDQGCACTRRERPSIPASTSCEDVWDNNSVFKCRREWMKCMQDNGCTKEVNKSN
ncbi:hypothetical protein Btru_072852 [Bulinus truncatus]|nr:hypothetical protein Btru_072852 [Bulinus truncatus]